MVCIISTIKRLLKEYVHSESGLFDPLPPGLFVFLVFSMLFPRRLHNFFLEIYAIISEQIVLLNDFQKSRANYSVQVLALKFFSEKNVFASNSLCGGSTISVED